MPSLTELLLGPFRGVSIYPRAARVPPGSTLALLLLVVLGCGLVLAAAFHARLGGQIEGLRDSQLYLMPRVTVDEGVATVEAAPGRTLDAGPFVLVLDTTVGKLDALPGERGDKRSVVHVTRTGLMIYKRDRRVATGYPWAGVNATFGRLSLDGAELVDWLLEFRSRLVAFAFVAVAPLVALWQLLLLLVWVGLYRTIFYRGLYVPRFATLVSVGAVAALPAVVLGAVLLLLGVSQMAVAGAHVLVFGVLFFVAATRVRLGDERPDQPAPELTDAPDGVDTFDVAEAPDQPAPDVAEVPDPPA